MKPSIDEFNIDPAFLPSESLWLAIEPLLPQHQPSPKGGRRRQCDRKMFFAIYTAVTGGYILRTGIQWKALPRCLGASSTVHDRFQQWTQAGVFEHLWATGLIEFNTDCGLDFEWQSIDGCMTKAPLGGEATGANPTDRAKCGTKRHLLTEGHGLPIGLVVTGAHRHDKTQVGAVLDSMPVLPPMPMPEYEQHFCADRGYDFDDIRSLVGLCGYVAHILGRGQERIHLQEPGFRARRWVCERTHSWMNRFRRLLIRWEKKLENYTAFLHLACATIVWRCCPVFG